MRVYTIDTGFFKLDGGAMFGVVPKSIWNRINPADENNMCSWAMRCLLIEDKNRLILIDCGIGNKQDEKFFSYYFLHGEDTLNSSLEKLGFSRDDITDVFLTHLHFDHCGGAVTKENGKLIPAFRNAVFWSNREHWDWATKPNEREKASFLRENIVPMLESGKLKLVDVPEESDEKLPLLEFTPGISIRFVHGHTRAMMLPQVSYRNQTMVFMADLLPSHGHIPLPYVMAYDMFPLSTLKEKKLFLEEAVEGNYVLFFEHDPVYECCRLMRTEKGIRPKEFFRLEDLV